MPSCLLSHPPHLISRPSPKPFSVSSCLIISYFFQDSEEADGEEADGGKLQHTARLDSVLVMFCVISPPLDTCSSREAFELLSRVFVAFDEEVKRSEMFKYHHFNSTFLVASPSAALRKNVFANRQQEVETMITLGLRLKDVAADFETPDGQALSLGVGLTAGTMVGRIVGAYRSYWSLFGDAINLSARLAALSTKAEWRTRCFAAGDVVGDGSDDADWKQDRMGGKGWEADPVRYSIACSVAVSGHAEADEGSPTDLLYDFEDVGIFDIKGKGETRVLAARLAPHVKEVEVTAQRTRDKAKNVTQRPHASSFAELQYFNSESSVSRTLATEKSNISRASTFVKFTAHRMNKHLADNVAGVGLYQLPNSVILELPSTAWFKRLAKKLGWSRRSSPSHLFHEPTLIT